MVRLLFAAVAPFLLLACDGGGAGKAVLTNHDARIVAGRAGQLPQTSGLDPSLLTRKRALAEAPFVSSIAGQIFAVGESRFANYFPSHRPTQSTGSIVYRHYPETGAYLGVDQNDERVYVLGGPFGGDILFVGMARNLITPRCEPVITGFNLKRQDQRPITESGGDGTGTGSADGGTGADGTLGGIDGADVELRDFRAQLVGTAVSDEKGLVTLRACGAVGPYYIEFRGNTKARYFDEGIAARDGNDANAWVPFPQGDYIGAWVESLDSHHITVSALTHSAAQQVNTAGGSLAARRIQALRANPLDAGRNVAAFEVSTSAVRTANQRIRNLFNQQFAGSGLTVDDITKMPALAFGLDSMRSFGNDARGQHAQVLTALAKSAAQFNAELPNPALEMAKQLQRDLSDGTLNGTDAAGTAVAPTTQRAYDTAQLAPTLVQQAAGRLNIQTLGLGSISIVRASQASVGCGSNSGGSGPCYPFGTSVTLSAQATPGWTFEGWSGNCSGSGTCEVTVTGDKIATATFVTNGPTLGVAKAGSGSGRVVSSPTGVDCGSACEARFPQGTRVTLTATAAGGSAFTGWSDSSCGQSTTCTVTLSAARTLTATFAPGQVLDVLKAGSGAGTVSSVDGRIACGNRCSATFATGTGVTLTASAAPGSTFIGWSEQSCQGTQCNVTLTAARRLTATFGADSLLSVTRSGSGSVSSTSGDINCGSSCSKAFPYGTQVTLVATADPGASFLGWSGACSGLQSSCTVTMDDARSVSAAFSQAQLQTLSVTVLGSGTVSSQPVGINNCPSGSCSASYAQNTVVSMLATPAFGANFLGWSGECTGTGACTVTMSASRNVTANFSSSSLNLGGTISGLTAPGLQLANAGVVIAVPAGATQFSFGAVLVLGRAYHVTIVTQPGGLSCSISNGSGTAGTSDVMSVTITCGAIGGSNWAWMGGSGSANPLGNYGTRGVPSTANIPSGRMGSATWRDGSGNLWLFGGVGNSGIPRYNDLWRFNPSSRAWTWMGGSNTPDAPGVYGSIGVGSVNNIPGARWGAVSWVDSSGYFWLFGGRGKDSSGADGLLNDLWRYSPSNGTWTWMRGSSAVNPTGTWGQLGSINDSRRPSGREGAVAWLGINGDLWLYGGFGRDISGAYGYLADLWTYSFFYGSWGWMGGSNTAATSPTYGSRGVPSTSNAPGSRYGSAAWTDTAGYFWLWGGATGFSEMRNELWRYNSATGAWTWMSGPNGPNGGGVYGTRGQPGPSNTPGSRFGATSWFDASAGALWMFGGGAVVGETISMFGDLWRYTPSDGMWTWIGGSSVMNVYGTYGLLGVPAPENTPGSLYGASAWFDPATGVWMFGGHGFGDQSTGYLNSLWRR